MIPSYGIAIILLTVILRGLFWPLQSAANKTMKQMQVMAPRIEQLREKYKNDPTRQNQEMLKLYKEHGINPAGGCFPLLVQMPVFIAFYVMLQSVVELRNESFLWIRDLTQPDTVAQLPILGIDVNPLPLVMTATSILSIRMAPKSGDESQRKMMMWMPLLFLAILYNFAAALSLYTVVSNLLSMVQTWWNLRHPLASLKKLPKKEARG